MAPEHPEAALAIARRISVPYFRSQALAVVSRWSDDQHAADIACEAIASAQSDADAYKSAAAMAWPIASLVERGDHALALESLARARQVAETAARNSSRACALVLLLKAAWPLGVATRRALIGEIAALQRVDSYWRVSQALVDALALVRDSDGEFAQGIVDQMREDKWIRKAKSTGPCAPPSFFRR